jgi:hypothetical protein
LGDNVSKYLKLFIYSFFILCITCINLAQAGTNPSSENLKNHPFFSPTEQTGMVFANVVAKLYIYTKTVTSTTTYASAVFACPPPATNCLFVQVPKCPPGTTYIYPTSAIDSSAIANCYYNRNGGCAGSWIAKSGANPWTMYGSMNFNITCAVNMQGWFTATYIKSLMQLNGNTQTAAPINNFNLGTYNVELTCDQQRACKCKTRLPNTPPEAGSELTQIPGYGQVCSNGGTDENQAFPNS